MIEAQLQTELLSLLTKPRRSFSLVPLPLKRRPLNAPSGPTTAGSFQGAASACDNQRFISVFLEEPQLLLSEGENVSI